jgi:hypothetical protein
MLYLGRKGSRKVVLQVNKLFFSLGCLLSSVEGMLKGKIDEEGVE